MRLFIFSCIQFLCLTLLSSGVVSQVTDEIHNRCKDVADYVGCITIFTGGQSSKESNEDRYANKLNEALRILSGRIDNTSLASFSSSIQPFTDAFSLARTDTKLADSDLVAGAEVLEVVLNGARQIWNHSINAKVHTMNIKNCRELNGLLDGINRSAGLMVGVAAPLPRWLRRVALPRGGLLLPPRPGQRLLHAPQLAGRRGLRRGSPGGRRRRRPRDQGIPLDGRRPRQPHVLPQLSRR